MCREIFRKRIKELRLEKKLSQSKMADLLNITLRSYQYYESNQKKTAMPSYDALIKLSNLFNVSIDFLLGCTDNPIRNLS
ncbi:MAG: helix-turn-helix domain-containing protein [Clostridiales bacterium]|jgi:transcriptional regulator with XRE-family HTH domain|nr:helix-turn-helix domain-containing protein [Clostridiales bacterium]